MSVVPFDFGNGVVANLPQNIIKYGKNVFLIVYDTSQPLPEIQGTEVVNGVTSNLAPVSLKSNPKALTQEEVADL